MKKLLQEIQKQKILVIGDVMLDHYVWGDVERISPEAPVPVVEVHKDTHVAGGAANVAINVTSLGAKCELSGWIGLDEAGERLEDILNKNHVGQELLFKKDNVPTILKTRVIVRNQQLCRLDRESKPSIYKIGGPTYFDMLKSIMSEVGGVIFSDYAKGAITEGFVQEVIQLAKENDCITAMDPKPSRHLEYSGVTLMTPNKAESYKLAGIDPDPNAPFPAEDICAAIYKKHKPHYLVITLGADGMLLSEDGKVSQTIPTVAREVFDVSGAGDTVVSSITAALAAGATLEEAVLLANTAAGIVVSKIGTATAKAPEILAYHNAHA